MSKDASENRDEPTAEELSAVFDMMADAVFIVGTDGIIRDCNEQACLSLGYSQEDLCGSPVWMIGPAKDEAEFRQMTAGAKEGKSMRIDGEQRRSDGTLFPISLHSRLISGADVNWFVSVVRDETENKKGVQMKLLETRLSVQSESLHRSTELIKWFAHDINNVLQAIGFFVMLIKEDPNDARLIADDMKYYVSQLAAMTLEMQKMSSVEDAKLTKTDLGKFLRSNARRFSSVLNRGTSLRIYVPDGDEFELFANDYQLMRLIMNLIMNAVQAGSTDISIVLESIPKPPTCVFQCGRCSTDLEFRLRVKDNGNGMSEDVLKNVFMPGYTTKRRGSGLGTVIAKTIVLHHGGTIHVQSHEGKGTEFFMCLPKAEVLEKIRGDQSRKRGERP